MEIFPKLGHFVIKDDDDVDDDMGCSSQPQGICPLLVSDPGIISLPTERGSSKKLDDDHDYDDYLFNFTPSGWLGLSRSPRRRMCHRGGLCLYL